MSDLHKILKEEYEKKLAITPNLLMEMIEEALETPAVFLIKEKDEAQSRTISVSMIPDIEVSELGWSDVRTPDGKGQPVKSRERELLENYLINIVGEERGMKALPQKLAALSTLADNPAAFIESQQSGGTPAAKIRSVISFLVFYKTLTKIIANFNASSAGFSFESFLATLLGGVQIPATGADTIADFVDEDGVKVSLKLYREASVHVDGSFVDLVGDLVTDGKMTYLVVTKDLKGSRENLTGMLNFYKFDFTLNNVLEIMKDTKSSSARCGILPIDTGTMADVEVPERLRVTPEWIQDQFVQNLTQAVGDQAIVDAVFSDPHFQYGSEEFNTPELTTGAKPVKGYHYSSNASKQAIVQLLRGIPALEQHDPPLALEDLALQIAQALKKVQGDVGVQKGARKQAVAQVVPAYASYTLPQGTKRTPDNTQRIENIKTAAYKSAAFYTDLSEDDKRRALLRSNGYLNELQFSLNKTEVIKLASKQKGGEDAEPLEGSLEIGTASLQAMLDSAVAALNTDIFSIFSDLQLLSDSLNTFFAGGLQSDDEAVQAIQSADSIEGKTKEIRDEEK